MLAAIIDSAAPQVPSFRFVDAVRIADAIVGAGWRPPAEGPAAADWLPVERQDVADLVHGMSPCPMSYKHGPHSDDYVTANELMKTFRMFTVVGDELGHAASDQAPDLERAPEPSSELAPSPLRQLAVANERIARLEELFNESRRDGMRVIRALGLGEDDAIDDVVARAEELFDRSLRQGEGEPAPGEAMWQIQITVPMRVDGRDLLFDAVVSAVAGWEPEDRDGWDADVSGAPAAAGLPAEVIEAAARAMYEHGSSGTWAWDQLAETSREQWRTHGRVAFSVFAGAGLLATTPPTPDPLRMAHEYGVTQRAALLDRVQETACDRRSAPDVKPGAETFQSPTENESPPEWKPCKTCGLYPDGDLGPRVRAVLLDGITEVEGVLQPAEMDEPRLIRLDDGTHLYICRIIAELPAPTENESGPHA